MPPLQGNNTNNVNPNNAAYRNQMNQPSLHPIPFYENGRNGSGSSQEPLNANFPPYSANYSNLQQNLQGNLQNFHNMNTGNNQKLNNINIQQLSANPLVDMNLANMNTNNNNATINQLTQMSLGLNNNFQLPQQLQLNQRQQQQKQLQQVLLQRQQQQLQGQRELPVQTSKLPIQQLQQQQQQLQQQQQQIQQQIQQQQQLQGQAQASHNILSDLSALPEDDVDVVLKKRSAPPTPPVSSEKKRRGRPKKLILDPSTNEYINSLHPNFKQLNKELKESELQQSGMAEHSIFKDEQISKLNDQPTYLRNLDDDAVKQLLQKKDRRGRPRKFPVEQTGITIKGIRVNGNKKKK